ncbi:aspartate kinase [Vibrio sp. JC009]|uniref:aspartate kinase n=1 Tax=Vibrio sp. JC009 TaxID=2912314 RepID=UPI0023B01C5E|nr:aspartate kinase [Vibrio sp. JC009]WED21408.1 aspartate kinase [Vibrio sp. JC009]
MNKPLHVLKFGGTSVGSIERISTVAKRVVEIKESGKNLVVVVSAMSGETNRLVGLAKEVDKVPAARELDVLLSAGEQVSMALLAMTLNKMGYPATSLTGGQAGIFTDSIHNDASIRHIETGLIHDLISDDQIVIVAGFQGVTENGDITTLGRGGSDTTAVALAGALNAEECQIFTDVDGVYSCDPRVVKDARKLDVIDFPNMEEMARKGAKVLHLPCVTHAKENSVPLRVRSSFSEDAGTLVKGQACQHGICGIALQKDLVFIQVEHSDLELLNKQCRLLGIRVWSVIEEANQKGVVVQQDAFDKLTLVFSEKIRNSEKVSSLTSVGSKAKGIVEHSSEVLSQAGIEIFASLTGQQYSMLLLKPEIVDRAANLIHKTFIVANETLEEQQKFAVI